MRRWFNRLKVSQKLMLICIFFVIPDSLMLYFFITTINANIQFAQMEQKGNEYQRPLEELLELIPQHGMLAPAAVAGEPQFREQLAKKQSQIDAAFRALEAVDARLGVELQFTDEGLAKHKREHYRVRTVKAEWQELKTHLAQLQPKACAEQHLHLIADVRMMITHAGDMSNLILDPELDSYYLVDVTLMTLPQTQDRLAAVMALVGDILNRQTFSNPERQQMAIYATLLKESDLDEITGSVQTSLHANVDFYGGSTNLQARVPPAFKEYSAAAGQFISLTTRLVDSEKIDMTAKDYLAAGNKARDASFKLWKIADEELDTLLQQRIEYYQHRRAKSLMVAALAVLAAITLVTFITRSISGPLRQQAAELNLANKTGQVLHDLFLAQLRGIFPGDQFTFGVQSVATHPKPDRAAVALGLRMEVVDQAGGFADADRQHSGRIRVEGSGVANAALAEDLPHLAHGAERCHTDWLVQGQNTYGHAVFTSAPAMISAAATRTLTRASFKG